MQALKATLPASGAVNVLKVVRNLEIWPIQLTTALGRVPATHRSGDLVRGKKTPFDIRVMFVQGGGCADAKGEGADAERAAFLSAYAGARGIGVSGGTRMILDGSPEVKSMVTERIVELADQEGRENFMVVGSVPVVSDTMGLVRYERGEFVGAGVQVDKWGSLINPNYDWTVIVQKGPDATYANADGGDYSGDLPTRYQWLTQLGQSGCYMPQFYYQNGGGVTVTEIVESTKLVMSGVFVAGSTVTLIEGTARKTDEIIGALTNPATRSDFCAAKFGGKEPTIARYGVDVSLDQVMNDVNEFGLLPNITIVPLAGLRAVNIGQGFIRS